MTRMQHRIEIARGPEATLAYAASPGLWPEWHPSSLRVDGAAGPLPAGTRFVRTLEYRFDGWSMRLANLFLLRRRIERESEESMHRLRRVAEARIAAAESV